jgi:hypothetical protein
MKRTSAAARLLAAAALLLAACASAGRPAVPAPPAPLGVEPGSDRTYFKIRVSYTNENDYGVPEDVRDIRAVVIRAPVDGRTYYRWVDYGVREYKAGAEPPAWRAPANTIGFEYFLDEETDYLAELPGTAALTRDMDGFTFYIGLIDFHMWDLYRNMFLRPAELGSPEKAPLEKPGDRIEYDLTAQPIKLLEWENVTSNLRMTAGAIEASYLGDRDGPDGRQKIIAFHQRQTLSQTIVGLGMAMPYDGTNRFLGHLYLDAADEPVAAEFREFVYGKVAAPMDATVIVHTTRVYSLERAASPDWSGEAAPLLQQSLAALGGRDFIDFEPGDRGEARGGGGQVGPSRHGGEVEKRAQEGDGDDEGQEDRHAADYPIDRRIGHLAHGEDRTLPRPVGQDDGQVGSH